MACSRKRRYQRREDAALAAAHLATVTRRRNPHPWPIDTYHCRECDGYHVGHVPMRELEATLDPSEIRAIIAHMPVIPGTCEVMVGGKFAAHRCNQQASFDLNAGRMVCPKHATSQRSAMVFTEHEAQVCYFDRERRRE